MKLINTSELKIGQIFSEPVYTIGDNLLVPANTPLRQKDINILITWSIKSVSTEGHLVESTPENEYEFDAEFEARIRAELKAELEKSHDLDPEPEPDVEDEILKKHYELAHKIDTAQFSIKDVQQNTGPYRAYKNLIEKLDTAFIVFKSGDDLEMRNIDNISILLLQDIREHPDSFVGFILGGEISKQDLAKSSVNTAILSALTAQELKLPNHKINNIVSGALLHDIGMLRLSKGITEKKGGLSDAEREQIKSHPIHSSRIVSKELYGPREVNLVALHHHERWDGEGYPDKLMGHAIDIGARIVSVADAFEAMVSKKSYRNSLVGYQAIKNLLADNARRFDPAVIIAFTKIIGIYPINSIVRLNNSAVARVTQIHPQAPMRPVVQLLIDERGKPVESKTPVIINLLVNKTMFIKEAVDPKAYDEKNI